MKKKTIKQRNIELLEAKGWTEDTTTRVTRYTVYSKPGVDYHYYLGRSGACRRGRTVGTSLSVKLKTTDEVVAELQDKLKGREGEQRPDPTTSPISTSAGSSSSPLADLLQRSVEITRLDTPTLLKVRCEDPDQEVRKVAHHELVKRGYTGGNQMVEARRKEVLA